MPDGFSRCAVSARAAAFARCCCVARAAPSAELPDPALPRGGESPFAGLAFSFFFPEDWMPPAGEPVRSGWVCGGGLLAVSE